MSVTIFAENLLETSAVTTATGAATASRLSDRERGAQWAAATAALHYIDLDTLGATVSGLAVVNANAGATLSVLGDAGSPPTTERATLAVAPNGVAAVAFAPVFARYWRVLIPAGAAPFKLGEVLLGRACVVSMNPYVSSNGRLTVANVQRDQSPGGYRWAARRGAARARFEWQWPWLPGADLAAIEAAYAACGEGAKAVVVVDQYGVARWMTWLDELLRPEPLGLDAYALALTFEEALG